MLLFSLLTALLLLTSPLQTATSQDRISFIFSEETRVDNAILTLEDGSQWRMMQTAEALGSLEAGSEIPVVLLGSRGSQSALVYALGTEIPVTRLSGEPVFAEGFRTMLLYADPETRRLHLADGTVRRITNADADLNFRSDRITEIIITRDRRHAIDLTTGTRYAVSPPVR
ncbi:hypothetical protein CYPRO_1507 [Cyclonatronum proteinivorum]|uniref:Uncharacterized protein n=1 Tax=Cyclonatronum proteinivorum TaxID=1457365 RepID=A0A345UJW1_9BACT|nr:hypothetical protein [Cyclonatronum proteinivorum]AXJ00763.1 hypothetical protein CYPRO_1507 [Cyclonatronum proteinivorum]